MKIFRINDKSNSLTEVSTMVDQSNLCNRDNETVKFYHSSGVVFTKSTAYSMFQVHNLNAKNNYLNIDANPVNFDISSLLSMDYSES